MSLVPVAALASGLACTTLQATALEASNRTLACCFACRLEFEPKKLRTAINTTRDVKGNGVRMETSPVLLAPPAAVA